MGGDLKDVFLFGYKIFGIIYKVFDKKEGAKIQPRCLWPTNRQYSLAH